MMDDGLSKDLEEQVRKLDAAISGPEAAGDGEQSPSLDSPLMVCAAVKKANSISDLHNNIKKMICDLGFSDYSFTRVGKVPDDPALSTLPKELYMLYVQGGFQEHDFLVRYATENTRPIYFSKVYGIAYDAPYDTGQFRANQQIYELNQKFGYLDHYCIPMPACDGGRNVMLMVSQRGIGSVDFQVKVAGHKAFLHVLCEAIDSVACTAFSETFVDKDEGGDIKINPKPLLVLSTLANNDMAMAAVADKLCISTITANQHIAAVRRELGVKTTVGAIKKAIKLGLIRYT